MSPSSKKILNSEIVFASKNAGERKSISNAVKQGTLRRLLPGIYTNDIQGRDEDIVRRNLYHILGKLYEGAIVSHRSATMGGVENDNIVLSYKFTKKIKLPGITVHLVEGPGPEASDLPFMGTLFLSSPSRAWLENLQNLYGHGFKKTLEQTKLEEIFCEELRIYGEDKFKERIAAAERIADHLDFKDELQKLKGIADAILGQTQDIGILKSDGAKQRALGKPYDSHRLELFQKLYSYLALAKNIPTPITLSSVISDRVSAANLCFFDAYFSNYIEGTKFEVEEAKKIVFQGFIPEKRPESHDVSATYQTLYEIYVNSPPQWREFDAFENQIKLYHSIIMKAHQTATPGFFKKVPNFAGQTNFVAPELVLGTLQKAFELYSSLPAGFAKAAFLSFAFSEIHPFLDGNGRMSRIILNRELYSDHKVPIIIPNVFRTDYLGALRKLTRSGEPQTYVKMLSRAQAFVASLSWSTYDSARAGLEKAKAFSDDADDKLIFS